MSILSEVEGPSVCICVYLWPTPSCPFVLIVVNIFCVHPCPSVANPFLSVRAFRGLTKLQAQRRNHLCASLYICGQPFRVHPERSRRAVYFVVNLFSLHSWHKKAPNNFGAPARFTSSSQTTSSTQTIPRGSPLHPQQQAPLFLQDHLCEYLQRES